MEYKEMNEKNLRRKKKRREQRLILLFILLVLIIGSILVGGIFLYQKKEAKITLTHEFQKDNPAFSFLLKENKEIADSFAKDLCVVTEDIPLNGVTISGDSTAALFDLNHQETLYAKDVFAKRYPASVTKVMTALLALKYGNLEDVVTVSATAMDIDKDSSVCDLKVGDKVKLKDLIEGLLIQSGNDAANAIAEHIGGDIPSFVEMMNEEAHKIGATGTHFVNAHGLHDENHYTTVYDVYLMFHKAMEYETFIKILNETSYKATVQGADGVSRDLVWEATNEYHTGESLPPRNVTVIGGKTGTTKAAGNCLALLSKDIYGNPYISIVLKAPLKTELYEDQNQLLNYLNQP